MDSSLSPSADSTMNCALDFPIEATITPKERWSRLYILGPLALSQQICLFLCLCSDFYDYSREGSKLVAITVSLTHTPIRAIALGNFFIVLMLDLGYIFLSIYRKGLTRMRFRLLWPVCSHHIGFGLLSARILSQSLQYVYGLSYVAFFSEFCFTLKLVLHFYFTRFSSDNTVGTEISEARRKLWIKQGRWQLRLLALDLFFGGGGTFSAIFLYALIIGDDVIDDRTQRNYTIIITLALVYWITQLLVHQRGLLDRVLERLCKEIPGQEYQESTRHQEPMDNSSSRDRFPSFESHASGALDLSNAGTRISFEGGSSMHSRTRECDSRPRRLTEDSTAV